jgi:uncharacterized membrane protein
MVMRLTEAWVRLYTMGLPEEVRKARQDEMKSDIWEHFQDLMRENKPLTEIISRLLRGIPADIIWRFNHSEGAIAKALMSLPQACIKVLAVLAVIFILLPLVTISLVIALFVVIILGFIIAFPFYYKTGTIILGPWVVDTFREAVIASLIGLALLSLIILLIWFGFRFARRHLYLRIGKLHVGWSE